MFDNLPSFFSPDFRVKQRDSLLEISRALTQELDIDSLLRRILTISVEILSGQASRRKYIQASEMEDGTSRKVNEQSGAGLTDFPDCR